jgi:hypothetical protein
MLQGKLKCTSEVEKRCSEDRALFEIMWKNMIQPDGSHIIRRMRVVYWISEVSDTHSEYVILTAYPQQLWLHERVSVLP